MTKAADSSPNASPEPGSPRLFGWQKSKIELLTKWRLFSLLTAKLPGVLTLSHPFLLEFNSNRLIIKIFVVDCTLQKISDMSLHRHLFCISILTTLSAIGFHDAVAQTGKEVVDFVAAGTPAQPNEYFSRTWQAHHANPASPSPTAKANQQKIGRAFSPLIARSPLDGTRIVSLANEPYPTKDDPSK